MKKSVCCTEFHHHSNTKTTEVGKEKRVCVFIFSDITMLYIRTNGLALTFWLLLDFINIFTLELIPNPFGTVYQAGVCENVYVSKRMGVCKNQRC